MTSRILIALFLVGMFGNAHALEVISPQVQTAEIVIIDSNHEINTLGKVTFHVDLSASHDDLLALKVRRSDLRLNDGRKFSAFGVHKDAGLVVLGGGNITHISISSVEDGDASVLFYGKGNSIISPKPNDIAVFDTEFNELEFAYTPLKAPGSLSVNVNLALDTSGSMKGHLDVVASNAQNFMQQLPEFTQCSLITFDAVVKHLSHKKDSCPDSAYLLNRPLQLGGYTALYQAIETGFANAPAKSSNSLPNIVVVITDGKNTSPYAGSLASLIEAKKQSNSKLFVFWAGDYDPLHLRGLADKELVSTQNLDQELERFFTSLGVSISGIQTLKIGK